MASTACARRSAIIAPGVTTSNCWLPRSCAVAMRCCEARCCVKRALMARYQARRRGSEPTRRDASRALPPPSRRRALRDLARSHAVVDVPVPVIVVAEADAPHRCGFAVEPPLCFQRPPVRECLRVFLDLSELGSRLFVGIFHD